MPVRKVSNRGGNIIGTFPSLKMMSKVKYESTIERDFQLFLEYDPTVIYYYAQPLVITQTDDSGEMHSYTPDFQVVRTHSKEIIECKPEVLVAGKHAQRQITMGQEWATNNNHDFAIVTDTNLRSGHTLANLKLLWRYSRLAVPTATLAHCIAYIELYPEGVSFQSLAIYLSAFASQEMKQSFLQAPLIYSMLFQHILHTELTTSITPTTLLKRSLVATAAPLTYIRPD